MKFMGIQSYRRFWLFKSDINNTSDRGRFLGEMNMSFWDG